jgi:hypothetical protein
MPIDGRARDSAHRKNTPFLLTSPIFSIVLFSFYVSFFPLLLLALRHRAEVGLSVCACRPWPSTTTKKKDGAAPSSGDFCAVGDHGFCGSGRGLFFVADVSRFFVSPKKNTRQTDEKVPPAFRGE